MNEARTSLTLAAAAAGAAFHDLRGVVEEAAGRTQMLVHAAEEYDLLAPERIFRGSTAPSLRPRNQRQRRRDDRRVRPHGRKGGKR